MSTPPPIPTKKFKTKLEAYMIPMVKNFRLQGLPIHLIAGGLGVAKSTFTKWIKEGQAEDCTDELKIALAATLEEASNTIGLEAIQMMKVHAMSDWKAAQALLAAQDPETWVPKKELKVDAKVEATTSKPDLSGLSLEDLQKLREINAKIEANKEKK